MVGYPAEADYKEILARTTGESQVDLKKVSSAKDILAMRQTARAVPVPEHVQDYAVRLVMGTQPGSSYSPELVNQYCVFGVEPPGGPGVAFGGQGQGPVGRALFRGGGGHRRGGEAGFAAPHPDGFPGPVGGHRYGSDRGSGFEERPGSQSTRVTSVTDTRSSAERLLKEPLFDGEFLDKVQRLRLVARRVAPRGRFAEQASKDRGSGLEFQDYRPYVPGDDLRAIDWNVYRRLGRVFLRLFEELEDLPVYLLPDISGSAWMEDPPRARAGFAGRAGPGCGLPGPTRIRWGCIPFPMT